MSDITNYAYIWYKKDLTKLLEFTPEELEIIYKIILDYSYPCYLANDSIRTMSEADRKELLEHELLFIQKKFEEACLVDFVIQQIPRVLYDLFNILYYKTKNLELKFRYSCTSLDNYIYLQNYIDYNLYTLKNSSDVKINIYELNNFILNYATTFLLEYVLDPEYIITDSDMKIIWRMLIIFESVITSINNLDIDDKKNYYKITDERKQVLNDVFKFEKQINKYGETILYRGASFEEDSTIYSIGTRRADLVSLSLNMSILSGFIGDSDACTLNYITRSTYNFKEKNNKIKYTIKKFYFNNSSNEFSLFFIPPIHPFLQLYCAGELWHPRTKIGYNINKFSFYSIQGFACREFKDFVENCDYLLSNKTFEELETLYQQYKSIGQISVWKKKYLKYKNKYLELKKYISLL